MKILFDLTSVQTKASNHFSGGVEYSKIVFAKLIEKAKSNEIICFYYKNRILPREIFNIIKENQLTAYKVQKKYDIVNIVNKIKPNKFYSPLPYELYGLDLGKMDVYYTIHGLRPIEIPTDKYEIYYIKNVRDISKFIFKQIFKSRYISIKKDQFHKIFNLSKNIHIFTSSYFTKYSILLHFPYLSENNIYVFYAPKEPTIYPAKSNLLETIGLRKKKYFLLISADRWVKNVIRGIIAFDQLFSDYSKIDKKVLVLGIEKNKIFKNIVNSSRFIFYRYVEKNVLEMFFKHAFAFIYPTLNEGFGYPPLTAMKYGTPVAASAITSVTEVCGDAALYFNPYSLEEIKIRILQLLFNDNTSTFYDTKRLIDRYKHISQIQENMLEKMISILLA